MRRCGSRSSRSRCFPRMNSEKTKANAPLFACLFALLCTLCWPERQSVAATETGNDSVETPEPRRFVVRGSALYDRTLGRDVFLRGMGYSPYLRGETPLYGDPPGDDGRYRIHFKRITELGVAYLHVFSARMPAGFFAALDDTNLVYGQDIWVHPNAEDFLAESFQQATLARTEAAIDHTYRVGRPQRLVLFSVGDELKAEAVRRTNRLHPEVRDFRGKHLVVRNRNPSEVAMARLIDEAMDYELRRYGQRHLYCHTSWTHIGPVAERPDLEVARGDVLNPDMGDLICLNVYTYARGVASSPPGSTTHTSYQGYLEDLARQSDKPIVITQVGLSTSPIAPKPWVPGFGGHAVADVPRQLRELWQDLRRAAGRDKYCGLVFFELHDEWWKSGEDGQDAFRHEEDDPEEWFGIFELGENGDLLPKGDIPATVRELFSERSEWGGMQ